MKKFGILIGLFILIIYFTSIHNVNSQSNFSSGNSYNYNQPRNAQDNVLIILDASYSMIDNLDGERKIDIAKNAINQVLSQLPSNVWVGLRVFGDKTGFLGFNSCKASELKVAIGPGNQSLISTELSKIEPVGMTPMVYSLEQAIDNDFIGKSGVKHIILVSDGMDTCGGDPCEFAINLVKNHAGVKIDAIGFDLDEQIAMSQLKCTALATKGKFYAANNSKDLTDSLRKSLTTSEEVFGKVVK